MRERRTYKTNFILVDKKNTKSRTWRKQKSPGRKSNNRMSQSQTKDATNTDKVKVNWNTTPQRKKKKKTSNQNQALIDHPKRDQGAANEIPKENVCSTNK